MTTTLRTEGNITGEIRIGKSKMNEQYNRQRKDEEHLPVKPLRTNNLRQFKI